MRMAHLCGGLVLLLASAGHALVVRGDAHWVASVECPIGWERPEFDVSSWKPVRFPWLQMWPKRWPVDPDARPFWEASGNFDVCVRRTFRLDQLPPAGTRAHVWVDDDYQFYLNGILVADNEDAQAPLPGETYDVAALLRTGENVVALRLRNRAAVMGALFSLRLPGIPDEPGSLADAWRQVRSWLWGATLVAVVFSFARLLRRRRKVWAQPLHRLPAGLVAVFAVTVAASCQGLLLAFPLWQGKWDQPVAQWDSTGVALIAVLLLLLFVLRAAVPTGRDVGAVRNERFVFLGILLLATFLRAYRVDEIPVGFYQDEATNANDALALTDLGGIQLWSQSVGGRPTLFLYMLLGVLRVFGESYATLKILPVSLGVATVAAVYGFARVALGPRTALWAAFFLAVSRWHIHYSRMAWEAICVPLFLTGGLALLLAALRSPRPRAQGTLLLLAGGVLSAGLYTYAAYRAVPLVVCTFLLATWGTSERSLLSRPPMRTHLLAAAVVAFAIALPLLAFAWTHPTHFWERYNEISLASFMHYYNTPSPWLHQLGKSILSFTGRGDELIRHNLPFAAHLDPITGVLFLLGLATPAPGLPHLGLRLLWTWFLTLALFGSLTLEAPHATRLLGLAPAAAIFAAFGTVQLFHILCRGRRRARRLLGAGIVLACTALNAHAYFVLEANHADADFQYDFTGRVLCEYLRGRDGVDVYWTDDIAFWADGQCQFLARGRYTPHDLWIDDLRQGRPDPGSSGTTVVVLGREFLDRHRDVLPHDREGRLRLPYPVTPLIQRDRQGEVVYCLYAF